MHTHFYRVDTFSYLAKIAESFASTNTFLFYKSVQSWNGDDAMRKFRGQTYSIKYKPPKVEHHIFKPT